MNIGILKEYNSSRVVISPITAKKIIDAGHNIFFVSGVGYESGFVDKKYQRAGAIKKFTNSDIIENSDILVCYKIPKIEELQKLKKGQILLCYSNILNNEKKVKIISQKGATLLDIQFLRKNNLFEVAKNINKVVAQLSVIYASYFYNNPPKGGGRVMGNFSKMSATKIGIIGFGKLGKYIASILLKQNCNITIFEKNKSKFLNIKNINFVSTQNKNFESILAENDIVFSCISEGIKPINRFLSKEFVQRLKMNSLVVDLSINNGATFETSIGKSLQDPLYIYEGVSHFCPNDILEKSSKTFSPYISSILFEYILMLANGGIKHQNFRRSLFVYNGKINKNIEFIKKENTNSATDPFDLIDENIANSWKGEDINDILDSINDYSYDM